jgi:pyridoxamine 5'-phosphate oxidase
MEAQLAGMRVDYRRDELDVGDLAATWHEQLVRWMDDATEAGVVEPNAMVLATTDDDGVPDSRTVLCKDVDERGIVFYTNYDSAKASDLDANPHASAVFVWLAHQRQVRLSGTVAKVDRAETEAYFASRPRESQIGAWASPQSEVVPTRAALDALAAAAEARFADEPIPAPPHWGGYRLRPDAVEFWQGRQGRLHDRIRYRVDGGTWLRERLAP